MISLAHKMHLFNFHRKTCIMMTSQLTIQWKKKISQTTVGNERVQRETARLNAFSFYLHMVKQNTRFP